MLCCCAAEFAYGTLCLRLRTCRAGPLAAGRQGRDAFVPDRARRDGVDMRVRRTRRYVASRGAGCSRNYVAASWYLVGLSRQFGLVKSMVAFRCDVPHMLLICRTDWVRAHVQRGRAPLHRVRTQGAWPAARRPRRPETADPRRPTRPPHGEPTRIHGPESTDLRPQPLFLSHGPSSAEPRASCNAKANGRGAALRE